jgi:hypothetical protein
LVSISCLKEDIQKIIKILIDIIIIKYY